MINHVMFLGLKINLKHPSDQLNVIIYISFNLNLNDAPFSWWII